MNIQIWSFFGVTNFSLPQYSCKFFRLPQAKNFENWGLNVKLKPYLQKSSIICGKCIILVGSIVSWGGRTLKEVTVGYLGHRPTRPTVPSDSVNRVSIGCQSVSVGSKGCQLAVGRLSVGCRSAFFLLLLHHGVGRLFAPFFKCRSFILGDQQHYAVRRFKWITQLYAHPVGRLILTCKKQGNADRQGWKAVGRLKRITKD